MDGVQLKPLIHSGPTISWWLGLNAAEQAAWAAALIGIVAAFGSIAAAWSSFLAARTALAIAKGDRDQRALERDQDAAQANLRAALLLQASFTQLTATVRFAIERIQAYRAAGGNQVFGGLNNDPVWVLGVETLERIGGLDQHALGVSGPLGDAVLRSLAWSRETAAMVERTLLPVDREVYCLLAIHMDDLLNSYRALLACADRAQVEIDRLAGAEIELAEL